MRELQVRMMAMGLLLLCQGLFEPMLRRRIPPIARLCMGLILMLIAWCLKYFAGV